MKIFVLLYCHTDQDLPGNILFFETVRTGFPDANIHVFDNDSKPVYRDLFREKTREINGNFHVIKNAVSHSSFILNRSNRALVFSV